MPRDSQTLDLFEGDSLHNREEEQVLLQRIKTLPFREFEFHGFTGRRRIVSFGCAMILINGGGLAKTEDIPEFLSGFRARRADIG